MVGADVQQLMSLAVRSAASFSRLEHPQRSVGHAIRVSAEVGPCAATFLGNKVGFAHDSAECVPGAASSMAAAIDDARLPGSCQAGWFDRG